MEKTSDEPKAPENPPEPEPTPHETAPKKSSAAKPLLFVGIGCLVILVLIGVGLTIGAKFLFSKFGGAMVKNAIEQNTGVKMDIDSLKEGKASFTDSKTGETVSFGTNELPKSFPKDFPVYPGAKVAGSVSGGGNDKSGFWVTLTSSDAVSKVTSYYQTELPKNDYEVTESANMGKLETLTFRKGNVAGGVTITGPDENAKDTTIMIAFGENTTEKMEKTEPTTEPEVTQ